MYHSIFVCRFLKTRMLFRKFSCIAYAFNSCYNKKWNTGIVGFMADEVECHIENKTGKLPFSWMLTTTIKQQFVQLGSIWLLWSSDLLNCPYRKWIFCSHHFIIHIGYSINLLSWNFLTEIVKTGAKNDTPGLVFSLSDILQFARCPVKTVSSLTPKDKGAKKESMYYRIRSKGS